MTSLTEARAQIEEFRAEISSLSMSYHELRELETILNRTLSLLERSTGSKEVKEAINALQRLMTTIRMAQFTIHAFYAATGPIGWALAGVSALTTLAIMADSMGPYEVTSH